MYYVYRRESDGFIGVVNASEKLGAGENPERLRRRDLITGKNIHTVLLGTDDWAEASKLIEAQRALAPQCVFNTLQPPALPPDDPAEVKQRAVDDIATQLKSIRERLRHVHGNIADLHGVGHPAQSTLEIALVALNDAIRFNKKGEF